MDWPFCTGETIGLVIGAGSTLIVGSSWLYVLCTGGCREARLREAAAAELFLAAPPPPPAPPRKKRKKKKKARIALPAPQPLPAAEPPRPKKRLGVRWYPGRWSRVRSRFHLDEDCSDARLARLLRKHGLDVTTTHEKGRQGTTDPSQLALASAERRVVITCDRHFPAMHERGVPHAGIVHAPKGPEWFQEILRVCLRLSGEVAEK